MADEKDDRCTCQRCGGHIPEEFYCLRCGFVPDWRAYRLTPVLERRVA